MEKTRFWNGVWVADTRGGYDTIGIYTKKGADGAMFKAVCEGTVDTTSVIDVVGAAIMTEVGPNYETIGGNVDEGSFELLVADTEVGVM
ncbi:hypothetical protein KI387_034169, partial [Taxus chinensis]